MADAAKKVRAEVRKAQAAFERDQEKLETTRATRRKSFEKAREAGLSTRDIAEEAGLHYTRVAEILRAK
jgi:alkylation response protein AidB-like acyl-CoA dehydrogenase